VKSVRLARPDALKIERVASEHFNAAQLDVGMSPLCFRIAAALDPGEIVERRRSNFLRLLEQLGDLHEPVFSTLPAGVCPQFFPLRVPNKEHFLRAMLKHGVESVNFWSVTPTSLCARDFPETTELRRTVVELPCHQDLDVQEIDWIAESVRRALPAARPVALAS
jgi:dTDP-4-amino-4,6-dideoxygalactose transaminase